MDLGELMTRDVEVVSPDVSAEDAWERMQDRRFHHLVVAEKGVVVGVVSAGDLGGEGGSRWRLYRSVKDCMTLAPVCATPRTELARAAAMLRGRSIGCLPVLDGKRLVGIVTVADLLDLIAGGHGSHPVSGSKGGYRERRERHDETSGDGR